MKTVDLTGKKLTVDDLLKIAARGSVRIRTKQGSSFILEKADDFDNEVKLLGQSRRFKRFLDQRSKEPATKTLEEYRRSM
jgi:hypothetical protein